MSYSTELNPGNLLFSYYKIPFFIFETRKHLEDMAILPCQGVFRWASRIRSSRTRGRKGSETTLQMSMKEWHINHFDKSIKMPYQLKI